MLLGAGEGTQPCRVPRKRSICGDIVHYRNLWKRPAILMDIMDDIDVFRPQLRIRYFLFAEDANGGDGVPGLGELRVRIRPHRDV